MANLIVGTEDCSILDVWTILSNSYIIKEKWSDFAGYLRIPSEDIEKLRLDQLHDKINRNDILKKILHIWVADQGSNAKLKELIRVVEKECGDNYVGEKLRLAKNLPRKNLENILTNWTAFQENVEQNISKFCPQIPNGNEYCSMHDVWTVLSKSEIIKEKWSDFAGFLRIPVEDIERLRQALLLDKINPNYVLIQVLIFWVGHQAGNAQLTELIRVVEDECKDNSVGEKLRILHNLPCKNFQSDKTTWELLAPAFQEKVKRNLSEYFPNIPIDSVKSKLQGDTLLDLMTGKKPTLFKSIIPPCPAFYLKRMLLSRHTISEKVFEEAAPDVFLFTGLNEFDLGKLVKRHDTSTSDEQLDSSEIHVRFLILKLKNHFEKICKKAKPGTPVHLLSYEKNSGKFKWVQTHGSVTLLQRFVEESQDPLIEKQFMSSLVNKGSGPVIISDGPGMGKSFLLANIALKLQKTGDKIVVFTSVNEFMKQVKLNGCDTTAQDPITVTLQNLICKNELGTLEFHELLSASDNKIELLLDGFDEISMNDSAFALDKVKIINESFKSVRLWITTRPHYLEELEDKLSVLGYNIKGLDEEDQVQFLVSQWQHSKTKQEDQTLDKDKLALYAHKVLRITKSKLNKDDNDIAGAPLQCLLIGDVYEEDCIAFASGNDAESLPTIRINSISNLYENMITKKFKKYIETHVTTEFAGMDTLICAHVDLSIKLLFSGYHPQLDYIQVDLKDLLNIGIIQASSTPGNTDFIHRTFAEYFVAGYVVEKLSKGEVENSSFANFFLGEILMRKQHLYHILSGTSITSYRFVHQIVGYFINDCLSQAVAFPSNVRFSIEAPTKRMEISHACANSSFLKIFKLFLDLENAGLDDALILLTIRNSAFEYFTFTISCLGETIAAFNEQQLSNFLRAAVVRSEPSIVKYLIRRPTFSELIENVNDSTKLLLHDCVSNTKYKPVDEIEKRVGVIQHLVEISPNLLEEKDDMGRTPLLCEHVHVDLLKELIILGADISSQDMRGDTILHLSKDKSRRLNANEYHLLITCIPKQKLAKVLKMAANDEKTPLERLLSFIDPRKETLRILFEEQLIAFMYVFRVAIENGRNFQTLDILIKLGVDLTVKGKDGESYLHFASYCGNLDAVKLLIENYNFDVNTPDNRFLTPMDYALASYVDNRFETAKALHNFGGRASEQIRLQIKPILNNAIKAGNAQSIRIIQEILNYENAKFVDSKITNESERNKGLSLSEEKFELLVRNVTQQNYTEYRDTHGWPLLHLAALRGDEVAVKELVENGAELDKRDFTESTALHHACCCADLSIGFRIIKFLIDKGADAYALNIDNYSFVNILLARLSHANLSPSQFHEIVEYLAERNLVKILFTTPSGSEGHTPLHIACFLLDLKEETIMTLYHKDVSMNHLDYNGNNALIYAIRGGKNKEFLNILVKKVNADWTQRDKSGNNSLHYAATCGHVDAIKLLMDLGLDINEVNVLGETPLHNVAECGKKNILETAKTLVEAGININKRNNSGKTALDLVQLRKVDDTFDNDIRTEFMNILETRSMDNASMPNATLTDAKRESKETKSAEKSNELLLHQAVIESEKIHVCLNLIKSLIPTESNVYAKDQEGHTFLHKLLLSNKFLSSDLHDISKYLIDAGHKNLFETPGGKSDATALHYAVKNFEPNLETLLLLKSHGINFNRLDNVGNSILAYAVYGKRSSEFLSLLVNEFGVSWKRLANSKQNLFHIAVHLGNEDAIKLFIKLGLNINASDITGNTPIMYAIGFGCDDILKRLPLLLANGADVNVKNNKQQTPLHYTAHMKEQSNILPVIKFLIESGANIFAVDCDNFTFLHMLTQKIDGICPITPLIFHQLAEYLIEFDLYKLFHNPGGKEANTPAQLAIWNLELQNDTLSLLYSNKTDINYRDKEGNSCLSYAIAGKQSRGVCQHLVNFGADINQRTVHGHTLLHTSAIFGIPEIIELFVNSGLDVNGKDNLEQTPLHEAVSRKDIKIANKIIKCLIENGADPNLVDYKGNSPLYIAIIQPRQSLPLINYLIDNGANVDSLNFHNTNFIHLAAEKGGLEVLKLFLNMKALNINAIDNDGDTPLHCAMAQEESDYVLEKVQLFLEYGADINIANKKGKTAFDIVDGRTEWDEEVRDTLRGLLMSML